MALVAQIMASGIPSQAAKVINGGIYDNGALTASGTTKANALVLTLPKNYVSICSSGKAVGLPAANQGDEVEVYNNGANALAVFTPVGTTDNFTTLSANAGFTISAQKGARFSKCTSAIWMVNYSK